MKYDGGYDAKWDYDCGKKYDMKCGYEPKCDYDTEQYEGMDCCEPKMKCKVQKECVKTFTCQYKLYRICMYRLVKVCPRCGMEFDYHHHRGMCPHCR